MKKRFFIILCCTVAIPLYGISIVYNLKIAEATKRRAEQSPYRKPSIGAVTLVNQFRKRFDSTRQAINVALTTLMYSPGSFYLRVDTAFGNVRERNDITEIHHSRFQMDDVVFYGGYTYTINEYTRLTLSGLVGFPTHALAFNGIELGTGHTGIGIQGDYSWIYSANNRHSLIGAVRFLHFIPRNKQIVINNQPRLFRVNLGNVVDVLIAHRSDWFRHKFEIGYNPNFSFGASLKPSLPIINVQPFARSSFYSTYQYVFLIKNRFPSAFIIGLSGGYDHSFNAFLYKYLVTTWISWGINF